jgi:hypothetical protein
MKSARRLESALCCAKTQMLMPPIVVTAFKAAREPVTSIVVVATMVAVAFAAGAALRPAKRVGVDWEHRQFMPRDEQGPIVPGLPRGPVWYAEPQTRRI